MKEDIKSFIKSKIFFVFAVVFILAAVLSYPAFKLFDNYVLGYFVKPDFGEVYVDYKNNYWVANGSVKYPFKDLPEAVEFVNNSPEFKKIIVNNGRYNGKVELNKGVKIAGSGDQKPIINYPYDNFSPEEVRLFSQEKDSKGAVISLKGDNEISNLIIEGGYFGIYLKDNAKALIEDVEIKNSNKFGIYNQQYSDPKPENEFIIKNVKVSRSKTQGIYLQKAHCKILNCEIFDNGEEGADLHSGMTVEIKDSIVRNNGEGGLGTELGENDLTIENNIFKNNASSGINLQSEFENGRVYIAGNKIIENADYGIRCATHSSTQPLYFSRALRNHPSYIRRNNEIWGNVSEDIASRCEK